MNRQEVLQAAMGLRGMLDEPQLGFLYDLAQLAPEGAGCECGVLYGRSLVAWALARPWTQIYAVDTWDRGEKQFQAFERNMAALRLQPVVLGMASWLAAGELSEDLSFCFIDACHDPEAISRDVLVWPLKIMPDGIIAYHDYDTWKCPGIRQAVDCWQDIAHWQDLGMVGSTKAYRRGT